MVCALCRGELIVIGTAENGYVKITRCLDCDAQLLPPRSKKEPDTVYRSRTKSY